MVNCIFISSPTPNKGDADLYLIKVVLIYMVEL